MATWSESAAWEDLIRVVLFRKDDPRYDDAVNEIYSRIPRVTDFWRVVFERFELKVPFGSRPDWQPTGVTSPVEDTWLVRLLSNDGHYPDKPIINKFGLLATDGDLAWSAVYWPGVHPADDSRVAWLKMEEVYFFGAISLSVHPDVGRAVIHTQTAPKYLHIHPDASREVLLSRSREIAADLQQQGQDHIRHDRHPTPHIFEWDIAQEVESLLEAFTKFHSALLLRGLYKFLIAVEMRRFPHLLEEMALSAIISREAALELLRRKLSTTSGKRLKKEDVIDIIRVQFPTGEPFAEVLNGDWENRIIMVHPVSEYGEWWSPMMEYEECTDTLRHLMYLYRFLLLDEIWTPERETSTSN